MRLRIVGMMLLRRWYAVIAGVMAVSSLCYYLYGTVPVDYKSTGSVVLLPAADAVGPGGNPYLFLNGLGQAMDILVRRLSAPAAEDRLTQGSTTSSFTAVPDVTSGSSILVVTVKGRSSTETATVMDRIIDDVPLQLTAMQDELKVPNSSRISSMRVAAPTAPVVDSKPRIQAVAATGVAGLLVVLLLTALLDGIILRFKRRTSSKRPGRVSRHRGEPPGEPEEAPIDNAVPITKEREMVAALRGATKSGTAMGGITADQAKTQRPRRTSGDRG